MGAAPSIGMETVEVTYDTLEDLYGNVDVDTCPDEALDEASIVLKAADSNRVSVSHE